MKIEISGQNLNTGQSFKNYAEEKLQKSTNKYFERKPNPANNPSNIQSKILLFAIPFHK